jgi:putative transposase
LVTLGIKVAASTVWEILKDEGINPAPERTATTWAAFLRSQAEALLACDFIETVTLTGQRQYILAVIEHAARRVRVLGTRPIPPLPGSPKRRGTWSWTWKKPEPESST